MKNKQYISCLIYVYRAFTITSNTIIIWTQFCFKQLELQKQYEINSIFFCNNLSLNLMNKDTIPRNHEISRSMDNPDWNSWIPY